MEKQILVFGKAAQKLSELPPQSKQIERKHIQKSGEAGGLKLGLMENVTMGTNTFMSGMLDNVNFPILTNWEEAKIKCELGVLSRYCCIRASTPGKAEQASYLQIFWVT